MSKKLLENPERISKVDGQPYLNFLVYKQKWKINLQAKPPQQSSPCSTLCLTESWNHRKIRIPICSWYEHNAWYHAKFKTSFAPKVNMVLVVASRIFFLIHNSCAVQLGQNSYFRSRNSLIPFLIKIWVRNQAKSVCLCYISDTLDDKVVGIAYISNAFSQTFTRMKIGWISKYIKHINKHINETEL